MRTAARWITEHNPRGRTASAVSHGSTRSEDDQRSSTPTMYAHPDFEQIARALATHFMGIGVVLEGAQLQRNERLIAEQLRLVWNARGAADDHVVTLRSMELLGTAGGGIYAIHFTRTIKALDR